ncbi:MAG: hypothetical protein AB7Y46_03480 [Armatimonadota bacterium]
MRQVLLAAIALLCCLRAGANDFVFAPLDDFEDASPWVKGDPNTDMAQRDSAVVPSREVVHEGEQSLAFMVRVNWTPREGEQYPKGWPMMSRDLNPPQDWSAYDRVFFWLYTQTDDALPPDRVLRVAFLIEGEEVVGGPWYTIPGIVAGQWQEISVPLEPGRDWTRVNRISFYVAEAWYQDGDEVTFYVDDMRLARRTEPVLLSASASARIAGRGTLALEVAVEGHPDPARHSVRCTVTDLVGAQQASFRWRLEAAAQQFSMDLAGAEPGGHRARIELLAGERVLDRREQYFRSLPSGRNTYLSLISFYSSRVWREEDWEALALLNDSAYAGVALPLWTAYETGPVPSWEELLPRLEAVRDRLEIDAWPWVFVNRFVGSPEDASGHASRNAPDPAYFERIPILDLDDETGARSDMLAMWRLAVRAARYWQAPGIVLDLEAYNNYRSYAVQYVAERRGESPAETIGKCELLGEELARIVEEEYPQCVVWTLFTRLEVISPIEGYESTVHPVPGHISLGFLRYAQEHHLPCKLLCGGETTPGYYNPDPEALRAKIIQRDRDMAPYLERFPEHLFLAGTISPYHDLSINTGFMAAKEGEARTLRTLEDFAPMFETLFAAYQWNWIYASSAAQTQPYDPAHSAMYSAALGTAQERARAR